MFTGIIEAVGSIKQRTKSGSDMRLMVEVGNLDMNDVVPGDSIAVNGVCLTVVEMDSNSFSADVSGETLAHTTLASCTNGQHINLEKALTPSSRLGGHLVSGHVDGVGKIVERTTDGKSERFIIEAPQNLARYIARKGSICVDGISLTVNSVDSRTFSLNIVPHTLDNTTMANYQPGTQVNLEVDVIARYIERMIFSAEESSAEESSGNDLSIDSLREHGFLK